MQIAIATTDGLTVDEHFGRAKKFLIFTVTPDAFNLLAEKTVEPYATSDKDHSFDADRFKKTAEALKGCSKVFVTKIGEEPAKALLREGIEPVVHAGPIRDINL